MITNAPLWETMKKKKVTQYALMEHHHVSRGTVQRLRKDMPMNTSTIDMLCKILDCKVEEVIQYIPDEEETAKP